MANRITFKGRITKRPIAPPARSVGPSREDCDACEWMRDGRCFHPRNGRPCNPARNKPWTWGLPCPLK